MTEVEVENVLAILDIPTVVAEQPESEWVYDPKKSEKDWLEHQAKFGRTESDFETEICEAIDSAGLAYERQKRVGNGIIDIFIYGQPPIIIELKRDDSVFSLIQAITQVKFYALAFNQKPHLFVCFMTGRPVREEFHPIMAELGIGELRITYDEETWRIFNYQYFIPGGQNHG